MSNLIQIKRSLTTATPVSLANGELAFTANGDQLFIGSNGVVVPIGGKKVPGVLTANQALVANATSGIDKVIVANAVITNITANGSIGSNGQVLVTNGSAIYWGTGTSGSNTQVQFNDSGVANATAGFTFDKVSNTLTVSNTISTTTVLATTVNAAVHSVGSSVIANTLGVYTTGTVNGAVLSVGTNFVANTSALTTTVSNVDATSALLRIKDLSVSNSGTFTADLTVNGNTTLGNATGDTIDFKGRVSNTVTPSSNVTYDLGTTALRWGTVFAGTVNSVSGNFSGSVSIGGDLTVAGNVTTTNVTSVIVADPMIYLAGNNYSSDLLDIGFAANYYDGAERHTGLFRDHDDGIWKLFTNLTQELSGNNDVDTSDPTYRTATLQAYIRTPGLQTNGTNIAITANSTVSVNVTANSISAGSLTLTVTPLAATSGGTGLSSVTPEDILVANTSNGFRKLGLGASGYVLQSNGTALVYDVLDGGSF
jgi:hypothetical protein